MFFPFALVIIDQFNVMGVRALEAENNTPVCSHTDRPKPLKVSFEWMQAIARQVKLLRGCRSIENGQNLLNCIHEIWAYPASVPAFIESFEAAVLKTPNHYCTS